MLRERYQILDQLTVRGDLRAWRARDTETDVEVFVKELVLEYVESWKAIELFEREIAVLRQLDHAMVPRYLDSWTETEGELATFGIARVWVEGTPLASLLDEERRGLDEGRVRRMITEVADLLAYLHRFRPPVVHRDITPSHIIERPDGSFMVIGFGGVQAALPRTRGGSTFVGSSGYIPPEQLMGSAAPASDIYGLGVTAAALLSGFEANDLPVVDMRVQLGEHVDPSPELLSLLDSMTDPVAETRPPDGAALLRRLEQFDTQLTRVEATLLDHPAPDTLRTTVTDGRLVITVGNKFRRAANFEWVVMSTMMLLGLGAAWWAYNALLRGPEFAIVSTAVFGAQYAVLGVFGVLAAFGASLIPKRLVLDREKGWTLWRTRLLGWEWSDVSDVQLASGPNTVSVLIERNDDLTPIMTLLTHDEAEWVRDRIRERLK